MPGIRFAGLVVQLAIAALVLAPAFGLDAAFARTSKSSKTHSHSGSPAGLRSHGLPAQAAASARKSKLPHRKSSLSGMPGHAGKRSHNIASQHAGGDAGKRHRITSAHQHTNKVALEREATAIQPTKKQSLEDQEYPPDKLCLPYEEETRKLNRCYELHDIGLNDLARGDLGLAVKHLREATQVSGDYYIRSCPTEALLYYDLGVAAEAAEQQDVAREAFTQALERNPNLFDARIRLATVLARQGKHSEAVESARRAVEMQPLDSRGHLILGLLLERQGQLSEAKAEKYRSRSLLQSHPVSSPQSPASESGPSPDNEPPDELP